MFNDCLVCGSSSAEYIDEFKTTDYLGINCIICGKFLIKRKLPLNINTFGKEDIKLISHYIRRGYENSKSPQELTVDKINKIISEGAFPDPSVMADYLILWIGENTKNIGKPVEIDFDQVRSVIGAKSDDDIIYTFNEINTLKLFSSFTIWIDTAQTSLSFKGWEEYKKLKYGFTTSNRVFMAMKFKQADLNKLFTEFYKPTLKKNGYELFKLDDDPKAGSITNRMRVAIKESKFIIADLSYGNRGAYWEAGFGEGLGKHVIYSVNESTLDKDHHFDVQGQQAVIWTADNMPKAAADLEACVKATFF